MTPEEDKIFGAFLECSLAPLEGVRTYEYMTNLNVYLNLSLSAVNCTLGCGTLGHLVLTAQSAVFNTHCGTEFVTLINPGIHPVIPDPAPTAVILSELLMTHNHRVRLFKRIPCSRSCVQESHQQVDPREILQVSFRLHQWLREGCKPQEPNSPYHRVS